MDNSQREKLNEILKDNDDFIDNTELIRELKHSELLKLNVEKLIIFKQTNKKLLESDKEKYDNLLKKECFFLFSNYSDIFKKLKEDDMNISVMFKMIDIYKEIEDGKLDQNEASFKLGTLLKEIYVDKAIAKISEDKPIKQISYKEWNIKRQHILNNLK
tara:strand:- start:720 stop:1196 length:477 start_codon:yes stop_codon:yes gene_type:complete